MTDKYTLPPDIKPPWLAPIRRLQSAAKLQNGLAVLSFSVLVDQSGNPVCWTSPKAVVLEPHGASSEILNLLINGINGLDLD